MCDELKKRMDYLYTQREGGYYKNELLDMAIQPIYGALAPEEQMAVFAETPLGVRKVVIATNIAETSLTIDG